MTGFGHANGSFAGVDWSWELRSVNAKALDLRFRLSATAEPFESAFRAQVGARIARGTVHAALSLGTAAPRGRVSVDRAALRAILAIPAAFPGRIDRTPPRLADLMQVRGVIEIAEGERATAPEAVLREGLEQALDALLRARCEEGTRLGAVLETHLTQIADLVGQARASAILQPEAIRQRLTEKLERLLDGRADMPTDRLIQEVAILATRADATEELDRLDGHLVQARGLLAEGGAVGRKLDFLCQEFGREANTLTAKSADLSVTRIGLDLKATIEQFREQIQNLE
jgi:uncharacterized protein (TIGR00255 family)